jgi:hypothetical protein
MKQEFSVPPMLVSLQERVKEAFPNFEMDYPESWGGKLLLIDNTFCIHCSAPDIVSVGWKQKSTFIDDIIVYKRRGTEWGLQSRWNPIAKHEMYSGDFSRIGEFYKICNIVKLSLRPSSVQFILGCAQ